MGLKQGFSFSPQNPVSLFNEFSEYKEPLLCMMRFFSPFYAYWQRLGITTKFAAAFTVLIGLVVLVSFTSATALMIIRHKTENDIFTSMEINRLILAMNSGLEEVRRLETSFFLQLPLIGFQAAKERYAYLATGKILDLINLTEGLQQKITLSLPRSELQESTINLQFYFSAAQRHGKTFRETINYVERIAQKDTGLQRKLEDKLTSLHDKMLDLGQMDLTALFWKLQAYEKEYWLIRQRYAMQSAFNVGTTLIQALHNNVALSSADKEALIQLIHDFFFIAEEILHLEVQIKSKFNEFELQLEALTPIADQLMFMARKEVSQAKETIVTTQNLLLLLLLTMTACGVALAVSIAYLLNQSVTHNVIALTATADALKNGELEARAQISSRDEIGLLADSFNAMAGQISQLITGLERKIAEQKHSKQEMEHFVQRLAFHVDQTPLGVIEWDLDFRVLQWNNAAKNIFGYTVDEALGQYGTDLIILDEHKDHIPAFWHDLISQKKTDTQISKNVTKDGRTVICEWHNTPLINQEGETIGAASMVLDITEAKQLEAHLQKAQKMEEIGTLAGGIAHDFNNILSAIFGYTEIAQTKLPANSPIAADLAQVLKAGKRAKDLVQQILTFSRQTQQETQAIQISQVMNETLQLLRASIPSTISIQQNIDHDSGVVLCDPTQIHQIIMNLCTNAYHSMSKTGGVLTLAVRNIQISEQDTQHEKYPLPAGTYVEITVSDTGTGMDEHTKEKIFSPYYTTKEKGQGTGLGLSVVHGIVKGYGGHISVYSTPGQGTSFRVYLPALAEEVSSSAPVEQQVMPTGTERGLIVDDEELLADITKEVLENLGYTVTTITSSKKAWEIYQASPHNFDFIITDMTMPEMNGLELISKIRQLSPHIPVILCTGFSNLINEKKAEALGIAKYLMKPIVSHDLAHAVREVLDSSRT